MRNFNISVDGKAYTVSVEEIIGGQAAAPLVAAPAPAVQSPVQQAAPVAPAATMPAPAKAASAGGVKMTSPMPGLIKSLKFKNGDSVKEGDVVIILEAMKMENDITATCSGTISYSVNDGQDINSGDVMCVIA